MKPDSKPMNLFEWTMLIILSILWGGSFFFVGVAVDALPPLTIVSLRVSLASIILIAIMYVSGFTFPKNREICLTFCKLSLINNVIPFCLIAWGQMQIASGLASILNATTPLYTVIAAHLFTVDEKMNLPKVLGVTIGIAGVIFMIGHDALSGESETLWGQFAIIGAAISYSLAAIYGRRLKRFDVKPLTIATGQVTASSIILIPIALLVEKPYLLPNPEIKIWLAILGLATLSTAFAYILYFKILASAGATNAVLVTLLIPVSALLLGIIFLGEKIEVKHLIGMGLISTGLLAIDGRLPRYTRILLANRPGRKSIP